MSVYLVSTLRLLPAITRIISYGNSLKFSFNGVKLIYSEFNKFKISKNDISENDEKITFNDKLLIKDLTFRYNQGSKYIFKNLNFEINKGEMIGIFGKSGEGKSTFVDLISGLLVPEKGYVKIDSKILNIDNSKSWQSQLSYSPQNIFLFNESILTNIILNFDKDINYDKNHLSVITYHLDLDEFISNLHNKIDTYIGSLGKKLSGGQKQRIGIARTLMRNNNFLIFDESTSSLDKENQDNVFKLLDYLNKDKSMTILIISHQLEVLNKCNKVYELSKKLENTGYIKEIKSAAYEFVDDLASIYTYAQPISKNSLNGLVGIQPLEDGKVQFTGNVSLNFLNSLNYGEQLKINWRRMFNASQNLITEFNFPFLFNSDFQISGRIDMIKKDSSFFNFNSKFII